MEHSGLKIDVSFVDAFSNVAAAASRMAESMDAVAASMCQMIQKTPGVAARVPSSPVQAQAPPRRAMQLSGRLRPERK